MKQIKGSLTLEASLVLTVFLFAIFSLLYFVKIIYIHEQIQFAISEAAEEMSVGAYILDKTEILDLQQETYLKAKGNLENLENDFNDLTDSYNETISGVNGLINYKSETNNINIDLNNKSLDSLYVEEQSGSIADELVEQKDKLSGVVQSSYSTMSQLIDFLTFIAEDSKQIITSVGAVPGMEIVNNAAGTKILESIIGTYINDENYKNWGIIGGRAGMDFSESRFMLEDDDITIVVHYKIKIPFLSDAIKPLEIIQGVKVRAFTGNGNFNGKLNKKNSPNKEDKEIVYITKSGKKYHSDRNCRYIDVKIMAVPYGQIKNSKRICEVCEKEGIVLNDNTIVYTTSSSNIFHTDKSCWTIYRDVIAITKEDAIKEGYTPCSLCGEE